MTKQHGDARALCTAVTAVLLIYLMLTMMLGLNLFEHSSYDSYTLQALAWRSGSISLPQNYEWLELALYDGKVFVSFPPFPTVIMLVLTFLFNENTPSMAVNLALTLLSTGFAYAALRRMKQTPLAAAAISVFWIEGCNLTEIALYGGVWNIAQGCAFFFTTACVYLMESPPEEHRKMDMVFGPLCIAFAVGCRPFQAIYVPYVLYRLYLWCARPDQKPLYTLLNMIPYVILPGLTAIAYGAYNFVRFGNPLEFGHNYLPEFSTEGGIQFSFSHWLPNLQNILRLPYISENRLEFPRAYGFAFWLCNPVYVLAGIQTVKNIVRKEWDAEDGILLIAAFIHFNALLLHRTFGGWQWGTRYLIDLIPMLMLFRFREQRMLTAFDVIVMIWGVAFNVYGTIIFHLF